MCNKCNNSTIELGRKFIFVLSDELIEMCEGLGEDVLFTAEFDGAIAFKVTWDQDLKREDGKDHSIFTYAQMERAVKYKEFIILKEMESDT